MDAFHNTVRTSSGKRKRLEVSGGTSLVESGRAFIERLPEFHKIKLVVGIADVRGSSV